MESGRKLKVNWTQLLGQGVAPVIDMMDRDRQRLSTWTTEIDYLNYRLHNNMHGLQTTNTDYMHGLQTTETKRTTDTLTIIQTTRLRLQGLHGLQTT